MNRHQWKPYDACSQASDSEFTLTLTCVGNVHVSLSRTVEGLVLSMLTPTDGQPTKAKMTDDGARLLGAFLISEAGGSK